MGLRHGGDIVADILSENGVQRLFTLCGGHISPILVSAKALGIQIIDVRDEKSAVFAADATARITGRPQVAAVTAGPGVTNTLTAMKNAQLAQSPVILLGGATATLLRGRGALQDVPQLPLLQPSTKWAVRVTTLPQLSHTLARAFEVAKEGIPGPVFVEIPIDLLYPREWVTQWYMKEVQTNRLPSFAQRALQAFLRSHLFRQEHGPSLPRFPKLPPKKTTLPRVSTLRSIAHILATAQKPLLLLGSQTLALTSNPEPVAAAVRHMGIPTYLAGMARGLLGPDDALAFRHARTQALKEADVVVVCGFPFDFRLGYGRTFSRRTHVIAANLSQDELTKNRKPSIAVKTHPGQFLVALSDYVQPSSRWEEWFSTLRQREKNREAQIDEEASLPVEGINPLLLFRKLDSHMSADARLVVDGGDFAATCAYILRARAPLSWLDPGAFGTLGVGGGFALGAALASPGKEVWLVYGDGASAYSLAEFDSFARHKVAPIAIIGNDGSWSQIARDQVEMLHDDVGTRLLRSAYHWVAQGYGGEGLLLTKTDDIDATIARAQSLARQGRPVCINVHIQPTNFRKGSISI